MWNALAEITIPANLSVDTLGGKMLTDATTPVVTILTAAITITVILAVKRLVFRGVRGLAGRG